MPETLQPLVPLLAGAAVGIAGVDVVKRIQRFLARKHQS